MDNSSTVHTVIPAQPGYMALSLVVEENGYPDSWHSAPIIAWTIRSTIKDLDYSSDIEPVSDTPDAQTSAFQRPDGTVVFPYVQEFPDADAALDSMRMDYARMKELELQRKQQRKPGA